MSSENSVRNALSVIGGDVTLGAKIARHAGNSGTKVAIRDGNITRTYAELHAEALRIAGFLRYNGIRSGDRIGIWMPNNTAWVAIEIAASLAGVGIVAINSRYKSDEVGYMLSHSEAKALFLVSRQRDTEFLPLLEEITGSVKQLPGGTISAEKLPDLRHIILCDDTDGNGAFPFLHIGECKVGADLAQSEIAVDAEGILNIIYTSGTTSLPKGVLLSERAIVPHSGKVAEWFAVGAADIVMLITPFCGIYGLNALIMTLSIGATAVVVREFDAERTLDLIQEERVTFIGGTVDTAVRRWVEIQSAAPRDITSIAGSTIPVGWMQGKPEEEMPAVEEMLSVKLANVFGLSETNSMVIVGDPHDDARLRHPVSGKAIWPGIEVRIADPATGTQSALGDIGEILLRGPILFSGYLKNPEATKAAFTEDGWFRTGDLGSEDDRGYVFYRGRLKDIVKISGFTVAPAEIEQFLRGHPGIAGVQVVGFERNGRELLGAAIRRKSAELDASDVIEFCKGRIAGFKIPSAVVFVEAFPVRSSANSDKIDRGAVRMLLEGQAK